MKELFEAVRAGDLSKIRELVDRDPTLAIFAASILGDTGEIKSLLTSNRSLVNALSVDGWTPLHLAAFFGKTDAVRLLLNNGAQVKARSTNALENLPIHAAAAGGHVAVIKLLVDYGSPVDARQHGGWTPLHAAAQNGDLETAKILVDAGAIVAVRADNQQTPMDMALTKGQQAMVEFLEKSLEGGQR